MANHFWAEVIILLVRARECRAHVGRSLLENLLSVRITGRAHPTHQPYPVCLVVGLQLASAIEVTHGIRRLVQIEEEFADLTLDVVIIGVFARGLSEHRSRALVLMRRAIHPCEVELRSGVVALRVWF